MTISAMFFTSSTPSFTLSCKTHNPFFPRTACSVKPIVVRASSTSLDYSSVSVADKPAIPFKSNNWQWKFKDRFMNIYFEEHEKESSDPPQNILMVPTIFDVSTVEEWRTVARDICQRVGKVNWRATIVDWPGLGYSDRPKLDYNADVMEQFLVDFINSPDSPMGPSGDNLVIFEGGHAATITVRATKKSLLKPTAIAAVAPTWVGCFWSRF